MDIQIKTTSLIEILKLISIFNLSKSWPAAPTITYINDDFTIVGNIDRAQLDLIEKSCINWEYKGSK